MTSTWNGICRNLESSQTKRIVKAYEDWVCECIENGYKGWLVTLMFSQLGTNDRHILENIKMDLSYFYGRTITRFNRRTRSEARKILNPIFIASPDKPVPKKEKQELDEVRINNGHHAHGIMLTTGTARKGRQFDEDVAAELKYYIGSSRIIRIDVEAISHTPASATSYTLKGLVRGYFDNDDVQVFPKVVSELSSRK